MIDDVLEFTGELVLERFNDRRTDRSRRRLLALVLGVLLAGVGALVAVLESPPVGGVAVVVGVALFFYGL